MVLRSSCEMETLASEAALEFAYKWVANPKMYIGLILPNKCSFRTSNIVRLIKIVNRGSLDAEKNAYFMVKSNVTKYNDILHKQNELIWYPFETKKYNMDCLFLDSSSNPILQKKHFLFHYRNKENNTFRQILLRKPTNI